MKVKRSKLENNIINESRDCPKYRTNGLYTLVTTKRNNLIENSKTLIK
jgi:hypothetical protein